MNRILVVSGLSVIACLCCLVPTFLHAEDPVEVICGRTMDNGYRERAMAAQRLSPALSSAEIQTLYDFLASPVSAHPTLATNELAGIKNDVLNALVGQQRLPDTLGQVLLDNYTNTGNDPMWRAFALQHFYQYYKRRWLRPPLGGGASNEFDALHNGMVSNLWLAASGTNEAFCCVALHVLDGIATTNGSVRPEQVSIAAAVVANDLSRSAGLRAHAMEIASRLETREVLAEARKCAKSADNVLLRHTAIRALGLIGTPADEKLLEELAQSDDPGVRAAAADALAVYLDRHKKPHKPGCPCRHCRP